MAVDEGVVAPVIRNAQTAALGEIAARRRELTERAEADKLQPADLSGGTFTISNLGMYNVDAFTAIIVPPQAGNPGGGPHCGPRRGRRRRTRNPADDEPHAFDRPSRGRWRACRAILNDLAEAIGDPKKWLE